MKDELIFLGPRCDYNADTPTCPTGQTWQELEAEREANRLEIRKNKEVERKAFNLSPLEVHPFQVYSHPFLTGKALDDVVKKIINQAKAKKKKSKKKKTEPSLNLN